MEQELVLNAVLLPALGSAVLLAVVAALLWATCGHPAPRPAWRLAGRLLALVVVAPALASIARQEGSSMPVSAWPPAVSSEWLAPALAAAAMVALLVGPGVGRLGVLACAVGASAASMVLVAPPGLTGGLPQLAALAAAALSGIGASRVAAQPGPMPLVGWWLVLAAASAMVLLSGFAKLALVLGALSAGCAALAALFPFLPGMALGTPAAVALGCALATCAFLGCGYDEAGFPWWSWLLVALSPLGMALGTLKGVARRPMARHAVIVLAPAMIAGLALLLALAASGWIDRHGEDDGAASYGLSSRP